MPAHASIHAFCLCNQRRGWWPGACARAWSGWPPWRWGDDLAPPAALSWSWYAWGWYAWGLARLQQTAVALFGFRGGDYGRGGHGSRHLLWWSHQPACM